MIPSYAYFAGRIFECKINQDNNVQPMYVAKIYGVASNYISFFQTWGGKLKKNGNVQMLEWGFKPTVSFDTTYSSKVQSGHEISNQCKELTRQSNSMDVLTM